MLNHKNHCLECLTDEQFALLCETCKEGALFNVDCQDCGIYMLGNHRCMCGNRRVAIYCDNDSFYAESY